MSPLSAGPTAIVIGAGIAGLTAAHRMAGLGIQVKVLEASGRVGGRMSTDRVWGHILDRGAQFLSSEYHLLLALAKEAGCAHLIQETAKANAIVRGGKPCVLRSNHPFDALASGLLDLPSWLRLGWRTWQGRQALTGLPLDDYSQWAHLDTEDTASWCDRDLDGAIKEFIFEPMLEGFYFQAPEETSRALAWALTAFGYRGARTLTCAEGIGAIPEALAANLDISFHQTVQAIRHGQGGVELATSNGAMHSDFAVLAVPAPAALRLFGPEAGDLERQLMGTSYSSSILVACMTTEAFHLPEPLKSVYGVLIPRRERENIAAIAIEANKRPLRTSRGQVLNLMLSNTSAGRMMPLSDEEILPGLLREAGHHLPGLESHLEAARIYRWPEAEPRSPVGRADALRRYRTQCQTTPPPLVLAGDYMSMPYTEGAAEAGDWAARLIAAAAAAPAPGRAP